MKHNNSCHLVLENSMGRVLRSYRWDQPQIHLIHRQDTGRVEAHGELRSLKEQQIPFQLIKTSETQAIKEAGVSIPRIGRLKRVQPGEELRFGPSIVLEKEDESVIQRTLIWSAVIHVSVVALFFILYWVQTSFFEEQEVIVRVQPQSVQKIVTPKKKAVSASTKKIDRKKKVGKVKPKKKKVARKRPTKKNVNQLGALGALGALGGLRSGKKSGSGLKLKSALNHSGSGNNSGLKSLGKDTALMAGKGLIASSGGGGKVNRGTIGYGTRGRAGGKAGYGSLNIGGNSGGFDYPLQESGTVDGGLEKSQIEAVIRRNIGQIIYCYEKGLQAKPGLSGRVGVKFVIGGNGRVRTGQIHQTSLKSASVESCMIGKIKGWKFPKPHGNVDVKVNYPFELRRASKR